MVLEMPIGAVNVADRSLDLPEEEGIAAQAVCTIEGDFNYEIIGAPSQDPLREAPNEAELVSHRH